MIFVAPTKPLVAQQISACHEVCGIPGRDSIEMNGEMPAATRNRYVSPVSPCSEIYLTISFSG